MAEAQLRGFSVATRCRTVEEFVEKYYDRSDDSSIVVNTAETRTVGTECAFAILLANKQPVLAGVCVISEIYEDHNNRFGRPGMRLTIKRLGLESERVFAQLDALRSARRKRTMLMTPVPVVIVPDAKTAPGVQAAAALDVTVPRTTTQPLHRLGAQTPADLTSAEGRRRMTRPLRLDSVQIPPRDLEALQRAPRATPQTMTPANEIKADNAQRTTQTGMPKFTLETPAEGTKPKLSAGAFSAPRTDTRDVAKRRGPASPKDMPAKFVVEPRRRRNSTKRRPKPAHKLLQPLDAIKTPPLERTKLESTTVAEPIKLAAADRTQVDAPDHVPPVERVTRVGLDMLESGSIKTEPDPDAVTNVNSGTGETDTRAQGSNFVLPANPLMNLTDASLEGLVDCRLFEANVEFDPDDALLDRDISSKPAPSLDVAAFEAEVPPAPAPAKKETRRPRKSYKLERAPQLPDLPTPLVEPPRPAFVPSQPRKSWTRHLRQHANALGIVAAFAVGFGSVALWVTLRAPHVAAPVVAPKVVEAPEGPLLEVTTERAASITNVVGNGACVVNIVTNPAGAAVWAQGRRLGYAPVELHAPCVRQRIAAWSPRFLPATQLVTLSADAPSSVEVELARPTHTVLVKTFPNAAEVKYEGRSFGFTPTYVRVPGNTPVDLQITRPGFEALDYKLTSTERLGDQVAIRLTRTKSR